jgi:superfamily II RNA helicase
VAHTVTTLMSGLTLGLSAAQKSAILAQKDRLVDKKIGGDFSIHIFINLYNFQSLDSLIRGIGGHHAGIHKNDRIIIEGLFRSGNLPVLVSTSTLGLTDLFASILKAASNILYLFKPWE